MIDPLTRGALFHEVQFDLLSALRERRYAAGYPRQSGGGAEPGRREDSTTVPTSTMTSWRRRSKRSGTTASRRSAPICANGCGGWPRTRADGVRERFELSFGLRDREQADPASSADPVLIEGGLRLRGSIDLIERHQDGSVRVTDHKTGKVRANHGVVVGGGKSPPAGALWVGGRKAAGRAGRVRPALLLHLHRRLRRPRRRTQRQAAKRQRRNYQQDRARRRTARWSGSSAARSAKASFPPLRPKANAPGATTGWCADRTKSSARGANRPRGSRGWDSCGRCHEAGPASGNRDGAARQSRRD